MDFPGARRAGPRREPGLTLRRYALKKRLDALRKKEKRLIVGMETGGEPDKLGAVLVEISGNGDDTVLAILGFASRGVNRDLKAALSALEGEEEFGSEELAGINFLVLHNLTKLYDELLEAADAAGDEIDLVGLKCLEAGKFVFPADPGDLSEMTNRVVASRFRIGADDGTGDYLEVREPLLQGIVGEMIDRCAVGDDMREAVTVALLANEAIFSEGALEGGAAERGSKKAAACAAKKASAVSSGASTRGGSPCLCGEFFFPR